MPEALRKSHPKANLLFVKANRFSWALLTFAIVSALLATVSGGSGATRVHHSNRSFYPQRWTGTGSAQVEDQFRLFKSVALNATFYFADDVKKNFPYVKLSDKSAKSVKTGFISTPAPDFKVSK
jgi:hypothetical protein